MIDYHVHLWRHTPSLSLRATVSQLADYCGHAARLGVSGLAAELNAAGWRKPCAEAYPAAGLLGRLHDYGVPVTTASDAHQAADISWRIADLTKMALAAGYSEVTAFRGRNQEPQPI